MFRTVSEDFTTPNQVIITSSPVAIDDDTFEFAVLVTSSPANNFCDVAAGEEVRKRREGTLCFFCEQTLLLERMHSVNSCVSVDADTLAASGRSLIESLANALDNDFLEDVIDDNLVS